LYQRLDDTRFNLIVIGQPLPRSPLFASGGAVRAHVAREDAANDRILARHGIGKPAYFLLRPDGHVGLAGARLELADIERYFEQRGFRQHAQAEPAARATLRVA
jgi:hypothetical protein